MEVMIAMETAAFHIKSLQFQYMQTVARYHLMDMQKYFINMS